MKKLLFTLTALALVIALAIPMAVPVAAVDGGATNYAFIPNAEEASVSKVDLMAGPPVEVARYSTVEPRATPAYPLDKYRVSRLAMDSGGNAWALNSMTGQGYNQAGAQGSVARISGGPVAGETPGTDTSNSGGLAGIVSNDVRVTYFNLGIPGECPRTINIVEEGGNVYLWIGFYMGRYFQKYQYNPVGPTLIPVGASISVAPYTPYTAAIDGNGILWGVSRNASPYPNPAGAIGVFSFDTNNLAGGVTALAYDVPGTTGDNPYAILVKSDGMVWVSDGGDWGTNRTRYFAVYTPPTTVAYVGTTVSAQAMRGFMEAADGSIWATSIDGKVIQLTETASWVGAIILSGLGEMTGIGSDASGYYWVIQYGLDKMTRFDPANPPVGQVSVPLGDGPYAYGEFIETIPVTYDICGLKLADWEGDEIPLPDWEITLEKWDPEANGGAWVPLTSMLTDENGLYCFEDLEAGDYRVSEYLKDGWDQVSPVDNEHLVTLPEGASDCEDPETYYDFHNTPHLYCFDETACAAEAVAVQRFVEAPGNWFTYIEYYKGQGTVGTPKEYPLFAGQTHLAGTLLVYDVGNTLYVKYVAIDEDTYKGYCGGSWGFAEYHLQVEDEFVGFEAISTSVGKAKVPGSPIPGQCEYSFTYPEKVGETDWIQADNIGSDTDIFIFAHAAMWWCGYDCDVLQEIADAQNGD